MSPYRKQSIAANRIRGTGLPASYHQPYLHRKSPRWKYVVFLRCFSWKAADLASPINWSCGNKSISQHFGCCSKCCDILFFHKLQAFYDPKFRSSMIMFFFGLVPYFLHTYGTVILGHRDDGSNLMEVSTCTPLYAVSYPSYWVTYGQYAPFIDRFFCALLTSNATHLLSFRSYHFGLVIDALLFW